MNRDAHVATVLVAGLVYSAFAKAVVCAAEWLCDKLDRTRRERMLAAHEADCQRGGAYRSRVGEVDE